MSGMKILIERPGISANQKASNAYQQLGRLLSALELKVLPADTIDFIDREIEQLNAVPGIDRNFVKATKACQQRIIRTVEKKHKIVPRNYYRQLWMLLGMSVFGIPIGAAFGASSGNMGMLGIGLPIGMAIGIGVGTNMDRKALNEGRQLDVEIKN
jgi:hypothetical protein